MALWGWVMGAGAGRWVEGLLGVVWTLGIYFEGGAVWGVTFLVPCFGKKKKSYRYLFV